MGYVFAPAPVTAVPVVGSDDFLGGGFRIFSLAFEAERSDESSCPNQGGNDHDHRNRYRSKDHSAPNPVIEIRISETEPLSARQPAEAQVRRLVELDCFLVGGRPPQKPNLRIVLDDEPS